jgi:hypothetical protein
LLECEGQSLTRIPARRGAEFDSSYYSTAIATVPQGEKIFEIASARERVGEPEAVGVCLPRIAFISSS